MARRRDASDAGTQARELIHNLVAKPAGSGKYEVTAGARRLSVLKLMASEGRSIRGEPVTKAHPARVPLMVGDDASATEISLAENFERSAKNKDEG